MCDRQTDGHNYDPQDCASIAASRSKKQWYTPHTVYSTKLNAVWYLSKLYKQSHTSIDYINLQKMIIEY